MQFLYNIENVSAHYYYYATQL